MSRRVARALLMAVALLGGCASGPQPADWQLNSVESLQLFQHYYLTGDARDEPEFARARSELARTGREDLVARAELFRCAVRAASLELGDCPGFESLRAGASAEETAYAQYLSGNGAHQASDDPLSRLVAAAVRLKRGVVTQKEMEQAVDIASAQGWRRPLLAWLGVLEKRARDGGDAEAADRILRRMKLISG